MTATGLNVENVKFESVLSTQTESTEILRRMTAIAYTDGSLP
jgi:hypothetical protein